MNQIIATTVSGETMEKLYILADAAKYDVACTSSGVDRAGKEGMLGNSKACGICHSFSSDGRCISLLKILMTNHCVYDCKYCHNRSSNDIPRAAFDPDELCQLVIEFYKRNYIEGLFLSSGVINNPAYTMQLICDTLLMLRTKYRFNGYIHVKTIPGAPDDLLAVAGYLADRISVNLELPTVEGLKKLAPNKSFQTILNPMSKITSTISQHRLAIGKDAKMERAKINQHLPNSIFNQKSLESKLTPKKLTYTTAVLPQDPDFNTASSYSSNTNYGSTTDYVEAPSIGTSIPAASLGLILPGRNAVLSKADKLTRPFAPAGQSTQMIIGATEESDYSIIQTSETLYKTYDLKRVFYSGYIPINEDSALPALGTPVPLLREHRLYQADFLLRYYGFHSKELLSEDKPNFREEIDPKCEWALRHLGDFPVEVERASYDVLLRVPGIGPKSAQRIVNARRFGHLSFDALKKMGIVLKRAHYFITCNGKMMYKTPIEENYIFRQLTCDEAKDNWQISHSQDMYQQLSIFDYAGVV